MGTLKGMKKKEIRARMELLFPLLNLDKVKRKKDQGTVRRNETESASFAGAFKRSEDIDPR